jgi:hypothetical protein
VQASTGWAEADQAELGRSIAQLVQDRSALDPEGADALQACVTESTATALVAAFQGKLDTVADIFRTLTERPVAWPATPLREAC